MRAIPFPAIVSASGPVPTPKTSQPSSMRWQAVSIAASGVGALSIWSDPPFRNWTCQVIRDHIELCAARLGTSMESAIDGFYSHWRRLSTIAALAQADRNGREAEVICKAARGLTADRRD